MVERILHERWRRCYALPHWTPPGWWECDVACLSKAGYLTEYEIKTSRSDFTADSRKVKLGEFSLGREVVKRLVKVTDPPYQLRNKHDLLSKGDPAGPCRFYFVVPEGLVDLSEVPHWAGLITATMFRTQVRLRIDREPARLHNEKVTWKQSMYEALYFRYHRLLRSVEMEQLTDGEGI